MLRSGLFILTMVCTKRCTFTHTNWSNFYAPCKAVFSCHVWIKQLDLSVYLFIWSLAHIKRPTWKVALIIIIWSMLIVIGHGVTHSGEAKSADFDGFLERLTAEKCGLFRFGDALLRNRHLVLGLCFNFPGNCIVVGGGACRCSRVKINCISSG